MGQLAAALLTALGSPSAAYIPPSALPPVEEMRQPPAPRPRRIAGSGTSITAGTLTSTDNNAETAGRLWYGSMGKPGISGKMLHDPHVKQSVEYVTNPLRAATWRFKPASGDALDREIADFCSYCFLERLPWDLILDRIVGGAAADGFSLSEMTDDAMPVPAGRFPSHPRPAAALVPTGLHEIPASTIERWHARRDNPSQLEAVEQWQPYSDDEQCGYRTISADRIVRLTFGQNGGNFAGTAPLRSAYQPWDAKLLLLRLEAGGFERTAYGIPVAIAGEGAGDEELDDVALILEYMRSGVKNYAVLPSGYTISWEGAGENDLDKVNVAIERCNTDIAINVTAGFSRLGMIGPGSYALSTTQAGQYHLSTVGRAKLVSIVFSLGLDGWSPVERIVRANYGPDVALPVLESRNLPTRDYTAIMPLLTNAVNAKIITPDDPLEDEVREALQFGPRDPATARGEVAAVGTPAAVEPAEQDEPDEPEVTDEPEATADDEEAETVATDPDAPDPQAVSPTEALNGAQVTSLRQFILDVAAKQLPRETGVRTIAAAFPLSEKEADRVMGEVGRSFFSAPPPGSEPAPAAPTDEESDDA